MHGYVYATALILVIYVSFRNIILSMKSVDYWTVVMMNAIDALRILPLSLLPITIYTKMLEQNKIGKNQRANNTISIQ